LRNSADKLNALIARLSRYGAGAVPVSEPVDLGEIVRAVAARCNAAIAREQVFAIDIEPCRVLASRETLDQVLSHLVQNALDATDTSLGVFLNTRVHQDHEGEWGLIEVVDSGSGMSAEFVRNRLFTPFVSTKPGGFGIGAFEARELIIAMRGRLDVESREGLGSRFTVRLPMAPALEMPILMPATKAAAS